MNDKSTRFPLLRRLGKWLLVSTGILCILLAAALGIFRLLLGQIPEYQSELKIWVAAELGMDVDFATINVRLGLTGPELSLRDASIGDGFLLAEQASITLDPIALFSRDIRVSRLTLAGVLLTIERDASGSYRLGDYVMEPGAASLADSIPDSVVVRIRDSALRYVDTVQAREWAFSELELEVESDGEQLLASGSLNPPAGLARRIEWHAAGAQAPDGPADSSWQLATRIADLDLEQLGQLLPLAVPGAETGFGDLAAEAQWTGDGLQQLRVDVDFEDLRIGPESDGNVPFSELGLSADWQRTGAGDWAVGLTDIRIARADATWPRPLSAAFALVSDDGAMQSIRLAADFVRIADIEPLVRAFPEFQLTEQWDVFRPEGEISELDLVLERRDGDIRYDIDLQFDGLAFRQSGATPGLRGVAGRIDATEDSGTIEFASNAWEMYWPALFPRVVGAESLSGAVVWRQWRDVLNVTSVDLALGVFGDAARISFDLGIPLDQRPATLELQANLDRAELVAAKPYLPTPIMPGPVVDWLNRAIVGGRARDIELTFSGPLRAIPFDDGSGQFRVVADIEDTTLDYSFGWPLAEDLSGRIEFLNAGFTARASGRTLNNRGEDIAVTIAEMRQPLLTLSANAAGPLAGVVDYLRAAPQIASEFGPDFDRIAVTGGTGAVSLSLELPLLDPGRYRLAADLAVTDGALRVAGLAPGISDVNGTITADETSVTAPAIDAQFLGGPLTASLLPSDRAGYRAEIRVEGETTADAVAASFGLQRQDLLAGQTRWRGSLLLPSLDPLATTRTHVTLESNLTGVALRFPEPLAKAPGDPLNLRLDIDFAAAGRLEIRGNLGATRRFVLGLQATEAGIEFARGTVRFGGAEPMLPIQRGILVDGQLEKLELEPWFALAGATPLGDAGRLFLGADMQVVDFHAFGQQLGDTAIRVQRGADDWEVTLSSEAIAGDITIPRDTSTREAIVADMQRVYLAAKPGGDLGGLDPRKLPGIRVLAEEFGFGNRQLGRVEATIEPDARGLLLTRFSSATDHYAMELTGSWLRGSLGTRTTVDARVVSDDLQATLTELGLDPVMAGESAELTANVFWDSAPGGGWLDHLNGDVEVLVETGSLSEIDPGAGRMLGLMSIAALPRRLALDFRDVFQDGFAFDEIRGGFTIIDGNAYTDNLKLDGPVAEIGIIGRTGLRDRDYRQQIVVRSEPGNMLPTVAGLIGGPGAGAALFVFTRLFKKSFEVIGSVSYCISGSWEAPTVERIDDNATDRAAGCADLPDVMLSQVNSG